MSGMMIIDEDELGPESSTRDADGPKWWASIFYDLLMLFLFLHANRPFVAGSC